MLQAKNIHKTYYSGSKAIQVLKGVDLRIERGEFAALTGPSGAGKSTLLNILAGLDDPTSGKVFFQEQDLYRLSEAELASLRNKEIGFVFQFYHLLSEFNVLENVSMPAYIAAGSRSERRAFMQEALSLLESMGLEARSTHMPGELSGGEKQRVAIARALINRPAVLLCDEPTGNLDTRTGEEIIALLRQINSVRKMSVVMVTHNPELAKKADKIYHLKDGLLVN